VDKVWQDIRHLIIKTLLLAQVALARAYRRCVGPDDDACSCFEILGFDVLLDDTLKPWLLEVNHSPSFTCDSQIDTEIKEGVVRSTLRMLNMTSGSKRRNRARERQASEARLLSGVRGDRARTPQREEDLNLKSAFAFLAQASWQDRNAGMFTRIYPSDDRPDNLDRIEMHAGCLFGDRAAHAKRLGFDLRPSKSANLERLARASIRLNLRGLGDSRTDTLRGFTRPNETIFKMRPSGTGSTTGQKESRLGSSSFRSSLAKSPVTPSSSSRPGSPSPFLSARRPNSNRPVRASSAPRHRLLYPELKNSINDL